MACVDVDMSYESGFEEDDAFDNSDYEENVAPPKKGSKPVAKKAGKQSKALTAVLSPNKNIDNIPMPADGSKKTVEQMYQKKTQLEHILIRPDTYIGSVEPLTQPMFVLDAGYDGPDTSYGLAVIRAQVLCRIRDDRVFYADPPPRRSGAKGRARRHGRRLKCSDRRTQRNPDATLNLTDPRYGKIAVAA